jgi:UDP-glucose 4-epimerase
MSAFIITGAAGFIGAAVARKLVEQGHRVVTIDNLSTGYIENVPEGVEFYEADCQDQSIYFKIPQLKYEAIFHIAGQSSGEISFDDPSYDLRTNAESTLNLLKFALSVGCERFIFASTMSVYGVTEDLPVTEEKPCLPTSFYGVGKLASEHYLRIYEQYGIRSTSLRLFNVYGPGQNMKNLRQGMVSIFLAQLVDNNHVLVKGSGDRYRDFVYIDDVVSVFLACLDSVDSSGQIINIGNGIRTTVSELLENLIRLHGKDATYHCHGSTPGDLHGIYADTTKAAKLLNFLPFFTLEKGLKAMLSCIQN